MLHYQKDSIANLYFIGVGKKRLLFITFHFIILLRYLVKYGYFVKGVLNQSRLYICSRSFSDQSITVVCNKIVNDLWV